MATKRWIGTGGVTGDWGDTANWTGGLPIASDDIKIGADCAAAPTTNLTALNAVALGTVEFEETIGFDFGTSGAGGSVQLNCAEIIYGVTEASRKAYILQYAASPANLWVGSTGSGSLTIAGLLAIQQIEAGNVSFIRDPDFGSHGKVTTLSAGAIISGGTITIGTNVTVTTATVLGSPAITHSSTITDWTINGGTVTSSGAAGAGALVLQNSGAYQHNSNGGNVGSVKARDSSSFKRGGTQTSTYTLGASEMDPGATIDLGRSLSGTVAFTLRKAGTAKLTLPAGATLTIDEQNDA